MSVQGCLTCDLGVKENLLVCCPGNRFALYRDLDIKVVLPIIEHSQICTVMKIKTLNITGSNTSLDCIELLINFRNEVKKQKCYLWFH